LPIIQLLLAQRERELKKASSIKAIVLVPTRELVQQVYDHFDTLLKYCRGITLFNVNAEMPAQQQKSKLLEKPDILIATPSKLLDALKSKYINLQESLKYVVIDEADHILAFGHEQDVQEAVSYFPKVYQAFLMSATLNKDLDNLRKLILHNPAILQLEEPEIKTKQLTEYYFRCKESDKFVALYVLLKLKVIPNKAIIFVNNIDKCYKLKLFLERFGIQSAVLNSELPFNSRYNIIKQFNKRLFDYLIATDETFKDEESDDEEEMEDDTKKSKNSEKREYGVSRGVDFKGVQTVVNFDFPATAKSYIHRVGRTARGGAKGSALSLVVTNKEEPLLEETVKIRQADGADIKPYTMNTHVIDSFRYRAEDVLKDISPTSIKDARTKEIEVEMMNSAKLKSHFAENPKELELLRHAVVLQKKEQKHFSHLKSLPEYLFSATPFNDENGKRKFESKEDSFDYLGRDIKRPKKEKRKKKRKGQKTLKLLP